MLADFTGFKRIPFILKEFYISFDCEIIDKDKKPVTFVEFMKETGIVVDSIMIIGLIVFQKINIPPVYWSKLVCLSNSTEPCLVNSIIGFKEPIESIEYPGFYLIPYFGNYVISPCGILIKRSNGSFMMASKGSNGYYTYRMTDDSSKTQNMGRHRILCFAFKQYSADVHLLDVNHLNGIPGSDDLSNIEWATRQQNCTHAYETGLRDDNKEIEVKDNVNNRLYIFNSCAETARFFNVTVSTISNRAKSCGTKTYAGCQFRFKSNTEHWPDIDQSGNYIAIFEDGTSKSCDGIEAARLAGLTRTSLMRALREGRSVGTTNVKIIRKQDGSPHQE